MSTDKWDDKNRKDLLDFIIYNEQKFATSKDLFEHAGKQKEFKSFKEKNENISKYLEDRYNVIVKGWQVVTSEGKIFPPNELNIEQKLDLADFANFCLKPSFVKFTVIPYIREKEKQKADDLSKAMKEASLSEKKTQPRKSSNAATPVGKKNAAKSSASASQTPAVVPSQLVVHVNVPTTVQNSNTVESSPAVENSAATPTVKRGPRTKKDQ